MSWIIDGLRDHGLDSATLTTMPVVRPHHGHGLLTSPGDELGVISAYIAMRGTPHRDGGFCDWAVAEDDRETALQQLLDWALSLPGVEPEADLNTGPFYTRVMTGDILAAMRTQARRIGPHQAQTNTAIVYAGTAFREVTVLPQLGLAMAAQGSEDPAGFPWVAAVDAVTDVMRQVDAWCTYAHATRGFKAPSVFHPYHGSLGGQWLDPGNARESVEQGRLFDAFGVMRLPDTFLSDLSLEGDWQISRLPTPNQVLLEHERRADWFKDVHVQQQTLDHARRQLTQLLIDPTGQHVLDAWEPILRGWADTARRFPGSSPPNYWERRRTPRVTD